MHLSAVRGARQSRYRHCRIAWRFTGDCVRADLQHLCCSTCRQWLAGATGVPIRNVQVRAVIGLLKSRLEVRLNLSIRRLYPNRLDDLDPLLGFLADVFIKLLRTAADDRAAIA